MSVIPVGLTEARQDWRRIASAEPAHSTFCEFVRYGVTGTIAFAFDVTTLVVLTEAFAIHYLLSAAAGFAVGIVITYMLSIRWVFCSRRIASASLERIIFLIIGLGGLVINEVAMFSLTEWASLPYVASKVGAAALVFAFNFASRKMLLFTTANEPFRN